MASVCLLIMCYLSFCIKVPLNHPLVKQSELSDEGLTTLEALLAMCASTNISRYSFIGFFSQKIDKLSRNHLSNHLQNNKMVDVSNVFSFIVILGLRRNAF